MFDACTEDPEVAWLAILKILERHLTDDLEALLAAGPLETLLAWHGDSVIEKMVQEAERNPRFAHLLGGVWRHEMPREIWDRVCRARNEVW
ncbi:MAG TPA: hypothetical protein VKA67_12140, partial [Verrucomicrobiae bacterium]|nr:hypothetical protein [Verrucomicrobiae bacterium]